MASEQNTGQVIPTWIKASLFEPVFKEIFSNFQQIKDFQAKPALSAGENYASIMLRLEAKIELKDGSCKSKTLMLKTAHDNEMAKETLKNIDIFEVEHYMYREVVPEFEQIYTNAGVDIKFAPKSYEIATEHSYLLLEDLKPKGYKNINRLEGFDIQHTHAVLKVLAQWHAASAVLIAAKRNYKPVLFNNFFNEENREMMRNIYDKMTAIFLNCAKSYEGHELYYERLCQHKDDIVDEMFEANKQDEKEFNVLNHGDCWSNNVMFKYDELGNIVDTFLVDYQVPHIGTPAQDLYYLLLSSTRYELKIEKFDYFVKYYHDHLIKNLTLLKYPKKLPTLKDLHITLHKYNAWAYNISIGVMAAVLLDPSENAKMENYLSDSDEAVQFKIQLYSNPRYRKHMELVLPWLYYRGVF
ncbi:uncharacterized protein LOC135959603 [Calliphora vicina]|uniref:uncharacterized protein LOC135959603 n=1 Tax=Calliphora vicina TaxID=7373 RepID=UPI00325C0F60